MTPADYLGLAMEWAWRIHGNQVDKLGQPYMGHVLAVAAACAPLGPDGVCVALLHDALEDADPVTRNSLDDALSFKFEGDVEWAVRALTFRYENRQETRDAYYQRILADGMLATRVKLEDLTHNMRRLHLIEDGDIRDRLNIKYSHAWDVLAGELVLGAG